MVAMRSKFFTPNDTYKEMILHYSKTDGILAVTMYVLLMFIYYFMGVLYIQKQLYLGIPVNLLLIVACIILVLVRRQKLSSIGFTLKNIGKALMTGVVLGIIFSFFMNVLPNILARGKIISVNQALYNIFYYFIIISLSEEVIFRGYIQTRLYGLIKHDNHAVIVAGFLFYTIHLPFQMTVNGMQINLINMVVIVSMHFMMNYLYRRYNSLVGPTVFHGLLDWGGNLFR
jgi:membrane protease YdiL (CAAX protease family)